MAEVAEAALVGDQQNAVDPEEGQVLAVGLA